MGSALVPLVELALKDQADDLVGEQLRLFRSRIEKTGIAI